MSFRGEAVHMQCSILPSSSPPSLSDFFALMMPNLFDNEDDEDTLDWKPPIKVIKISNNGDEVDTHFSDTSSTLTIGSSDWEDSDCKTVSTSNTNCDSNAIMLDTLILQYPNPGDASPIKIFSKNLLSLLPGYRPDKPIIRFSLRYMIFNGLPYQMRSSILYFDLNVLEQYSVSALTTEDKLDFLRTHTLTPAKKYLVFPFELTNDPQDSPHIALVIVTDFEAMFRRSKEPCYNVLITFAYVLDPNAVFPDQQHRSKQLFRLSSLIKNYLSGLYHRYMRHSEATEILVVLRTILLPQAHFKTDTDLLTVTYLHYFFNNETHRRLILTRQLVDLRPLNLTFEVPCRKSIFEVILSHVNPSQRKTLRAQLTAKSGDPDFYQK